MRDTRRRVFLPVVPALALLVFLTDERPAQAGDITVFVSEGRPREIWAHGYGAALTTTLFRVVSFEGEAARLPAASPQNSMTSFTGSAFLSPPIGIFTPYGGVGVGLFRQTVGTGSDLGTLRARTVGLKVRFGGLFVVKAEYRQLELSGEPPLFTDTRISAGAGIQF